MKEGDKEGLFTVEVGCVNHDKPYKVLDAFFIPISLLLLSQLRESQLEHFEVNGVPPKRKLMEFPVTEDALLPIGTNTMILCKARPTVSQEYFEKS